MKKRGIIAAVCISSLIMLFICINFPRQPGKDVTSRDSFLEIVAQTINFHVWSGAQAIIHCSSIRRNIKNCISHSTASRGSILHVNETRAKGLCLRFLNLYWKVGIAQYFILIPSSLRRSATLSMISTISREKYLCLVISTGCARAN